MTGSNSLPCGYWQELTTTDFARIDPQRTVALLPVSACEQHGPHLPLSTDAEINNGIVSQMLSHPPAQAHVLVLPPQIIGDSIEHSAYPGTLSLDLSTLVASWLSIGNAVADTGIRKLIIFNTHGGQQGHVDQVATRLRVHRQMLVARANLGRLGKPDNLFDDNERAHGLHGGAIETSLMLHLRPDLVRMDQAENFRSSAEGLAQRNEHLAIERGVGIGWMAQDLNLSGVCGNAAAAEAGKGKVLLDYLASALAKLCDEIATTDLSLLQTRKK